MIVSCGLVITCRGKVLLGHVTNKKFWDIPKGQIEDNETYIECCLREVKEETGLDLYSVKDKFIDLGMFQFSKEKDLYLFKYECDHFFNVDNLKCTSFFEKNNRKYKEVDFFKYVDFYDLYRYTNNKLGLILCKILKTPLDYEQREEVRRTICYILRHKLPTDKKGKVSPWMDNCVLYQKCIETNPVLSVFSSKDFMTIINNDKNSRFSVSGNLIKANYGHSQDVERDDDYLFVPKDILYHLTFSNYLDSVLKEGLKPMTRQYVFLATTTDKAKDYKKKLKKIQLQNKDNSITPILLEIDAKGAYKNGIKFFKEKGQDIIYTNNIPAKYIRIKNNDFTINKNEYDFILNIFNKNNSKKNR